MTNGEKCELLKATIYQLYSKEGRSKSYISKLLQINRKVLIQKIKEWDFKESKSQRYAKPSTVKNINKNKEKVISLLNKGNNVSDITRELNISRKSFYECFLRYDEDIKEAFDRNVAEKKQAHNDLIEAQMQKSCRNYNITNFDNEIWKEINNFDDYFVSNYGRVKKEATRYKKCYLLTPNLNKKNGYYYVCMINNDGIRKNLSLARLVAFAFCSGHSDDKNTVNHIDGNKENNYYKNLEWTSLSENCMHCHQVLNKCNIPGEAFKFSKIIYQNKYEFKTITAYAKFIGMSQVQARRYLDEPEKHDIKIIL